MPRNNPNTGPDGVTRRGFLTSMGAGAIGVAASEDLFAAGKKTMRRSCRRARPPRSPCGLTAKPIKAGVKRDGTLTALEFTCLATGGAYPAGGTSLVDWLVRDLYTCPNVRATSTDVFINAGPARAFRAPGHPQGAWALEQMMDALAEAIGLDPVQLRLKNISSFSQAREGNPAYTTTGFKECLEQGAAAFGWEKARRETGP